MTLDPRSSSRRRMLIGGLGAAASTGLGALTGSALAQSAGDLEQPFANGSRKLVAFPEKRPLIVLTTRPPQLETPFAVFNEGLITPNDAFFVRYHNAGLPTSIDADTHVIKIGGNAAGKPFQVSVADLRTNFKPVEIVAVNQCSGNSRGLFNPRVTGGQLNNGAMGNARWVGARLKDVLAQAEIKSSAKQVTFDGLDTAIFGGGDFVKALDLNQAMDPDVLIAYQMNGADIPMLNGYPVKLVVPGYYGTYWVKHLSQIDVIDSVYDGFWMRPAYRIPDNDCACVAPGTAPAQTRPIGRFTVRSFVTSLSEGQRIRTGQQTVVRGIAFDGGHGIRQVGVSVDGGQTWNSAFLGDDLGRYSFREFTYGFTPDRAGPIDIRTCAWSRSGEAQPTTAVWQPAGYMRNVIESVKVVVA
jgi:sulfite dehydrogenase (cytochrome) subunit A